MSFVSSVCALRFYSGPVKYSSDIFVKIDILTLKLTVEISLPFNGKTFFMKNSFLLSHHTFKLIEEVVGVGGQQSQQMIRGKSVK